MDQYNAQELKKALHEIQLAIDAASTKHENSMGDLWKMLKTINSTLQDIADAVRGGKL